MNSDDIYKVIEGAVEKTVPPVVERVVNGKIRTLQTTVDTHVQKMNEHVERMTPVIEFLQTIGSLNRFLKWGGITFFAFLALLYMLIKR